MRASSPLLLAGLLLLPSLLALAPPAAAGTSRVLVISNGSAHPGHAFKNFDGNPAKLFDINGDGKKEIIAQNDNRYAYVFDSKTGALLAEITTTYPGGWGARSFNGPEVAIMVHGGVPHLILGNSAAYIADYAFDAAHSSSTHLAFVKKWERRLNDCYGNPGMDAKPVLADLDKDGKLEIVAQTEESGVFALRENGALYWKKCINGGNGEPGVGDVNADGYLDAVFCSDSGTCTAANGRTGATLWTYWVNGVHDFGSGSMPVAPTVAQIDGSGGADVLVGVRDSHDCDNYSNNHAALFAISGAGRLLWWKQPANAAPLTYTRPIVYDVDGDGHKDVLWGDWNTIGHACGNWEVVGRAHAFRFDRWGGQKWSTVLDTWWGNKDFALANVCCDGKQDVLASGPSGSHDGIWYLDSVNGTKEQFVDAYPYKVSRGPVVE
ncbi:MAG: VCBS repeat-containing protein, partial [Halobacteriales archaeon]|nr:VCBS repeat-containing protein [Halobacteriales archaeon]